MHGVELALVQKHAREGILKLQEAMQAMPECAMVSYPVRHFFEPDWYMREITVPEGQVVIGKIHRHAHQNNISVGLVRVVTEFGSDEMAAPFMFVSEPGTKRVVVTLRPTVWTTYHHNPTNTQDLAELEAMIIASTYEELQHDMVSSGRPCAVSGEPDHRGLTEGERGQHQRPESGGAAGAV